MHTIVSPSLKARDEEKRLERNAQGDLNDTRALGQAHNDLTKGNIIVNDDEVVALIAWERAGWFSVKLAVEIQQRNRYP